MEADSAEKLVVQGIYRLVGEVTKNNDLAHGQILERLGDIEGKIDRFWAHCEECRGEIDEGIEKAAKAPSPLELSVRTVSKFVVGLVINAGVAAGLVYTILRIAGAG